jgi:tetratricopeptide (TPR) repeat protein
MACDREISEGMPQPLPLNGAGAALRDAYCLWQDGGAAAAQTAGWRAVEAAPTAARAWHHLAVVLVAAGKLAAAREALERTVSLDPAASEARNNLGLVLQRLGDARGALAQYEAALALGPDIAELHSNRAAALAALGRYDEALDAARRAISLKPDLIVAHVHAAEIEKELARPEAALRRIEGVLPAASDNADILMVHADILGRLDRVDDALAAFGRAGSLAPRSGAPLAGAAALLCQLGRIEDANAALDRALALDPDCAAAWYTRAVMKRYAADDPDIAAMEAILREGRAQGDTERLWLHYALGGAYLDAGDGDSSFAHLHAGTGMKRALVTYDGAATERWMSDIAAAFPAALFAAGRCRGHECERPVFVIGMPRSGTTLIEQILASHPAVHAAGELRCLEQAIGRALSSRDLRAFPGAFAPEQGDAIAADYLARLAALAPAAERVIDKTLSNLAYAGLIHLMLPRARIVLCRRDPVDTCLSSYSKLFTNGQEFSYDLGELGRYYRAQDALALHWRHVLPPDIFLEIDYESVVADLEPAARRLVAFCGLPWSPACLAFHETPRPVRTASMAQVRQPIYRSSVGRWRRFETHLAPLLEALGSAL